MATNRKQMTPVEFWISLFPQAPLFGVEWQFAKLFPMIRRFNPMATATEATRASVDEAVKATAEAVEAAADLQEHVAASTATPMPMPAADAAVMAEEPATDEAAAGEDPGIPPASLYDIAPAQRDDLKRLKGVGPKLETMLNEMGIYRFDQIAAFTPENLAWVDANLTTFKGRPIRDDWVAQARALL